MSGSKVSKFLPSIFSKKIFQQKFPRPCHYAFVSTLFQKSQAKKCKLICHIRRTLHVNNSVRISSFYF